jgi:hypothetical protein
VLGATARNEFRLHIYGRGAGCLRNSVSLLARIDHRWDGQKIGDMDRQIYQQRADLAQFSSREVLGEQEIANVQSIVKRACKTSADQTLELPVLQKARHPLPANLFPNAGVNNLNRAVFDLTSDYSDAIVIAPGFIVETAKEP